MPPYNISQTTKPIHNAVHHIESTCKTIRSIVLISLHPTRLFLSLCKLIGATSTANKVFADQIVLDKMCKMA